MYFTSSDHLALAKEFIVKDVKQQMRYQKAEVERQMGPQKEWYGKKEQRRTKVKVQPRRLYIADPITRIRYTLAIGKVKEAHKMMQAVGQMKK